MIVCGEQYKATFKKYAKELHEIAKPTTTNGKPDRKPHSAVEALANLFDKFASIAVPFCDLDRFCYFIIKGAESECEKDKYAPWGEYGFELYNCTFEQVFRVRPELKPKGHILNCLNNIVYNRYGVFSIEDVKVGTFVNDFSEEEILSHRQVGPKTFRQIKNLIGELGLSFRKSDTEEVKEK